MRRRTLNKVGVAAGALLAVAGGTLALLQPARIGGRLSAPAAAFGTVLGLPVPFQSLTVGGDDAWNLVEIERARRDVVFQPAAGPYLSGRL